MQTCYIKTRYLSHAAYLSETVADQGTHFIIMVEKCDDFIYIFNFNKNNNACFYAISLFYCIYWHGRDCCDIFFTLLIMINDILMRKQIFLNCTFQIHINIYNY